MACPPQIDPVKVSGHMLCGEAETDESSDDSSCGDVVELERKQELEEKTTSASVARSSCEDVTLHMVDAEHSKQEPGGVVPLEVAGIVEGDALLSHIGFGSSPPAASHESRGDRGEHTSGSNDVASAQVTAEMGIDSQAADSAFGIVYRPHRSTMKQGYNLPSGRAFVDEDEFERELSAEFRVVAGSSGQAEPRRITGVESRQQCTEGAGAVHPGREKDDDDFFEETAADVFRSRAVCSSADRSQLGNGVLQTTAGSGGEASNSTDNSQPAKAPNIPIVPVDKTYAQVQDENAKALKHLTETYQNGGSTTQETIDHFIAPGGSAEALSQGLDDYINTNDSGVLAVHVGGDVRRCPVLEEGEEDEEDEEEDGGGEEEGERRDRMAEQEDPTKPHTHQASRLGDGRGDEADEQNEDSRRAQVEREWDEIDKLRTAENSVPMEKGVGGTLKPTAIDEGNRIVSTAEALRHFRTLDLSVHKAVIVPFQPRPGRLGFFRRAATLKMSGGEKLRDEVFLIAQIHYTPTDVMHRRLIQTIYRRLTKEKRVCPDIGPHWDIIGFQGNDPCTDLNRSMGVLALIQVLYLVETQPIFAAVLQRESTADVTGWPFLCVSIGFTKEAVGALRRGACYAECNRRGTVMDVVHELHQAQFYAFLTLCRKEPATHHALHIAKVRTLMETDTPNLAKAYRTHLSEEKAKLATGVVEEASRGVAHEELDFAGRYTVDANDRRRVELSGSRKLQYVTGGTSKAS